MDWTVIIVALLSGGVGGGLVALLKPPIVWHIEKKREQRDAVKLAIEDARYDVENMQGYGRRRSEAFVATTAFYQLKKHLSRRLIKNLQDLRRHHLQPAGPIEDIELEVGEKLLAELVKIERKFKLI